MKLVPMACSVALLAALVGCGGKDDAADAVAAEAAPPGAEAPAADESAETVVADLPPPSDGKAADFGTALEQRDYVRAADLIIQQSLSSQPGQADDSMVRMRELQMKLADAIAAGDPKAKQAAELLRRLGRPPR
ncbi:MAG: hypothetical protein ACKVYV_15100 [Limisphaerales bacterium]